MAPATESTAMLRMKSLFTLLSIFLIALGSPAHSQVDTVSNDLIPNETDSIRFSIWEVKTKEMSLPGQEIEYEKELEQALLSHNDQETLIANLLKPESYDQTRAQLYHYNLIFDLYNDGAVSARIYISAMTGNIDIDNKLKEIYFRNNCSKQLGEFLMGLLDQYDFVKSFDEIDLEGITSNNE